MEMAPKGLYKISIPSKPIKIGHAISLQNDKPAGCPNKHPYKMSPHYKMTEQGPLNAPKNHCPKNLYKISILQKSCSNDPKKISSTK